MAKQRYTIEQRIEYYSKKFKELTLEREHILMRILDLQRLQNMNNDQDWSQRLTDEINKLKEKA